jgi:hypothetical protein
MPISGSIAAAMQAENSGTKPPLERLKDDSLGQAPFRDPSMARSKNAKEVEVLLAPEIGGATGAGLGLH